MNPVLAGLFGLLWGSFLNVCIYRTPRNIGVVLPRSFCPECGASIRAADNIPVLSFILLRGRCRTCHASIAWRYPVVELLTAILFAAVFARYGLSMAALKWALFESLLVVLFFTDLEERMLPDEYTLGGIVIAFLLCFLVPLPGLAGYAFGSGLPEQVQSLINAAAGGIFLSLPMLALGRLYMLIRKREGMGLGDIKLMALIGATLGIESGVFALIIGSCAGALLGLILLLRRGGSAWQYELPFGSFLCAGAALLPLISLTR